MAVLLFGMESVKQVTPVVTAEEVLEAKSLPQGTSAQLAELVALIQALELSKGQWVNIYKDSKYAYLTLRAHAAIQKERQFKTATGEPIKHFREIERLLTAIYYPKEVAVMHCKGHSRDGSKIAEGNHLADCQARKGALYETPFTADGFDLERTCGTGKNTIY